MIDVMLAMDPDAVIPEASSHHNACGAGAIAAMMAAVGVLGARRAVLLEHTTSNETVGPDPGHNAVGYAGLVFTE
jgi:AmmeMemoRadiSam system protein B